MKLKKLDWYFIIYLFFVIFCPPIFDKYVTILFVSAYTFFCIILKYRFHWKTFMANKYIRASVITLIAVVGYWFFILSVNIFLGQTGDLRTYFRIIYRFSMLFIMLLLYIPYIFIYCKKKDYKRDIALKYIMYACCIQFFIALLFMLFPALRDKALVLMYNNTGIEQYMYDFESARRWYGFAISLQDGFSCGIGLAAGIAVYFSVRYDSKYIILYLMLVAVAAFNARTGVLMAALSIPFLITKKGRHLLETLSVLIIGIIFALLVMRNYFIATYEWIVTGFRQLAGFLIQEENVGGSIGTLFSERFWMIPDSVFEIIFGTGHSTIDVASVLQTDVGYVNYLWIFGFVGSIFLYSFLLVIYFYFRNIKNNKMYERLKLYFLIMLFIGNIKFDIFTYGPSIMLFLLIYYLELLDLKYIRFSKK